MPISKGAGPPSPPRLKSTGLPDESDGQAARPEPFLTGYPILPEDMDIADLTQAQLYEMNQRLLEESMESDRPLISPPEPITVLQHDYANSEHHLRQIDALIRQRYSIIIRAKGDGNCFYRALAFAYLDRLIRSQVPNKQAGLAETKNILAEAGFDECVYEQPYEILQDLSILRPPNANDELWQNFMDAATSNYIVMYMRLLTSAQIRIDDQFAAFISDPESATVDDFCRRSVEPLGKEADNVQVAALAQALNVHVRVAYLDGRSTDGRINFVDFSDKSEGVEPLVLLYRPGHYDILQKTPERQ